MNISMKRLKETLNNYKIRFLRKSKSKVFKVNILVKISNENMINLFIFAS